MSQESTVPDKTERHPCGFLFTTKFPGSKQVVAGEGASVYIPNTAGRFQIIVDEGALADLLDSEVADVLGMLVTVHHFNDESARDRFLSERYRTPGH